MKKIYIAGAGGMLGEAFYNVFKTDFLLKCSDIDQNSDWLSYLDFRDFEKYKTDVLNFKPDYLFHLGAITDLEQCEKDEKNAYLTNTLSVENAVIISNILDIPIIYISTAGIFDGKKDYYDDWDLPNPISIYGKSKYLGERYVIENKNNYLVLRAGWMMGGGIKKDKKFIKKIINQIDNGKTNLNIVDDKFGTPTYTYDFAENAKLLLNKELWGLYNLVCSGLSSRLDVTAEILKLLKLENKISIKKVDSSFFSDEYFAKRPLSERLINRKLELRKLNIMRDWKIALKEYLEKEF